MNVNVGRKRERASLNDDNRPLNYSDEFKINSDKKKVSKTVFKKIKKAIKSVKKYFSGKKEQNTNIQLEQLGTKLEVLENEMLHFVEDIAGQPIDNTDVSTNEATDASTNAATTNILENEYNIINNFFGDVIYNLTVELHKIISNAEATPPIVVSSDEPPKKSRSKSRSKSPKIPEIASTIAQAKIDNYTKLNEILKTLAELLINDKQKKELLYTPPVIGSDTHTIRVIGLRLSINYNSLEDFLEKIAAHVGFAQHLCWFANCTTEIKNGIIEYSKHYSKIKKASNKEIEYVKLFELFKNLAMVYLLSEKKRVYKSKDGLTLTSNIPSEIINLLQPTVGGKKKSRKQKGKKNLYI